MEDSQSQVPDACFIRAPTGVAEVLRCEVADAFSCLMVTSSEELVSRVIRVKVQEGANLHFPVTVAVPFCTRYRSNYRDVTVKIVDEARRASYVTPVTTEGTYGGQRVKFYTQMLTFFLMSEMPCINMYAFCYFFSPFSVIRRVYTKSQYQFCNPYVTAK